MAEEVNKFGYNFTGEQCRLKIKSLKEKYERSKKKQNKSGESPPDTDCEELMDIFDKCPDMKPTFVIDTGDNSGCGDAKESDGSVCRSSKESTTSLVSEPKGKKPLTTRKISSSPQSCSSDDGIHLYICTTLKSFV